MKRSQVQILGRPPNIMEEYDPVLEAEHLLNIENANREANLSASERDIAETIVMLRRIIEQGRPIPVWKNGLETEIRPGDPEYQYYQQMLGIEGH